MLERSTATDKGALPRVRAAVNQSRECMGAMEKAAVNSGKFIDPLPKGSVDATPVNFAAIANSSSGPGEPEASTIWR